MIELTECIISDISKIKPYKEYRKEFYKSKQKKLKNAIKFADKISLGEMSFEQHSSFIKKGIKLFEEQCKKLEEIKKEEKNRIKRINIGNKKDKINKKIRNENGNGDIKKKLIFKKRGMLGKKRKASSHIKSNSLMMDLTYSIDDFIYNKRDFKINDYNSFFRDIKAKMSERELNSNGLQVRQ